MVNRPRWSLLVIAVTCSASFAQVPPEIGDKLTAMGRVVDVSATASLYQGRVVETEPYGGVKIERDIRYGGGERNVLDVFAPAESAGKTLPVLIYVPGGGYVDSSRHVPNSPYFDSLMVWAVRNGMVAVNMNYRVVPKDPWPAALRM